MITVVHLFIRFCMVLNPSMCQELEITPVDAELTMPMCLKGAMMGNQSEFEYQNAHWRIKGATCRSVPLPTADMQKRLRSALQSQSQTSE